MLTIRPITDIQEQQECVAGMDKHERLRAARLKADFRSAAAAADAMGIAHSTYQAHENGNRDYDADNAAKYARKFKVSKSWLLYGEHDPNEQNSEEQSNVDWELLNLDDMPFDDIDRFKRAYSEAILLEKAKTGGRAARLTRAMLTWAIYDQLSKEEESTT